MPPSERRRAGPRRSSRLDRPARAEAGPPEPRAARISYAPRRLPAASVIGVRAFFQERRGSVNQRSREANSSNLTSSRSTGRPAARFEAMRSARETTKNGWPPYRISTRRSCLHVQSHAILEHGDLVGDNFLGRRERSRAETSIEQRVEQSAGVVERGIDEKVEIEGGPWNTVQNGRDAADHDVTDVMPAQAREDVLESVEHRGGQRVWGSPEARGP